MTDQKPKEDIQQQKRNSPVWKTQEIVDAICHRICEGESLRSICRDQGMPSIGTVLRWMTEEEKFKDQYALALKIRSDAFFEEIFDIADDSSKDYVERLDGDGSAQMVANAEHIQRSRLRVDTRKWAMGRMNPKKYGDLTRTELTGADGTPLQGLVTIVKELDGSASGLPKIEG